MQEGNQNRSILNKDTLIPLSALIVVTGGIMWITTLFVNTQQNTKDIAELQSEISALREQNIIVLERMARFETKLDLLLQQNGIGDIDD